MELSEHFAWNATQQLVEGKERHFIDQRRAVTNRDCHGLCSREKLCLYRPRGNKVIRETECWGPTDDPCSCFPNLSLHFVIVQATEIHVPYLQPRHPTQNCWHHFSPCFDEWDAALKLPSSTKLSGPSPHRHHSQPTFPHYSAMATMPPTAMFRPNPPLAPVLMPITTDCDPLMSELCLPSPIAVTQTVLVSIASWNLPTSNTNFQQEQPVNLQYTFPIAGPNIPRTVAFHPPQSSAQPCPIQVSNSSRQSASPPLSSAPSTCLPAPGAQILPAASINYAPSEAHL